MKKIKQMNWIPLKKIGPFIFETQIDDYIKKYQLTLIPEERDETVKWDVYKVSDIDMRIYTEEGMITSVALYDNCFYKGHNLIGMSFHDVMEVLSLPIPSAPSDIIEVDEEDEFIYELDSLEAQIWVRRKKVVTVYCGPLIIEEEDSSELAKNSSE